MTLSRTTYWAHIFTHYTILQLILEWKRHKRRGYCHSLVSCHFEQETEPGLKLQQVCLLIPVIVTALKPGSLPTGQLKESLSTTRLIFNMLAQEQQNSTDGRAFRPWRRERFSIHSMCGARLSTVASSWKSITKHTPPLKKTSSNDDVLVVMANNVKLTA